MFSGAGTGRPIEGTCALYPPDWNPLSSQPPLSPLTLHHQETQRSGPDWAQKALRTPGGSWPPRRSEALSLPTAGSAPSPARFPADGGGNAGSRAPSSGSCTCVLTFPIKKTIKMHLQFVRKSIVTSFFKKESPQMRQGIRASVF